MDNILNRKHLLLGITLQTVNGFSPFTIWSTTKKNLKNEVKAVVEKEAKPSMWQNLKNLNKIIF